MSFILSTLEPFQTVLAPTVKTSNVQFYKKPNAGSRLGSTINAPFTRAGAGRKVIDASGNLVDAAANVPAWTFPIGGSSAGCPYLSFLPSVENLLTYSEQFDNADWAKGGGVITVTANTDLSPDGTTNADTLDAGTSGSFNIVSQSKSITSNGTYTGFYFAKKVTSETNFGGIGINFTGGTSGAAYSILNAVNGTVNTVTSGTATIEDTGVIDFSSTYWLVYLTVTDGGTNTLGQFSIYGCLSTNGTTLGTGAWSDRVIWGAQLKEGSYISPLDYVKTEASAVTRAQDSITNITDLQGNGYLPSATEGALLYQLDFKSGQASPNNIFEILDTSGTRVFAFRIDLPGEADECKPTDYLNGQDIIQNIANEGLVKLLLNLDTTNLTVYYNGFQIYQVAATGFEFGRLKTLSSNQSALNLKFLHFAPTALTASQAEAASSWPSFDLMVSDLEYS